MPKKQFLWLFAACCLIPLAMAQLVLSSGWFSAGVNSKGQWLTEEVRLLAPVPASAPHWRLVYLAPADCLQSCMAALQLMTQIHTALGRKQDQLSLVVIGEQAPAQLPSVLKFSRLPAQGLTPGSLVLVEHQALALLQYQFPPQATELPLLGKAVMTDLKKLMNYDRGPV